MLDPERVQADECAASAIETPRFWKIILSIANGVSLGGKPWANLDFAWLPDALPGGIQEALFHRVHERAGRSYLPTREYARVEGHADARRAKLERLRTLRLAFDAAAAAANTPLRFGKRAGDHRGKNESDVGVLFFNTTSAVREWFPKVHAQLLERLRI